MSEANTVTLAARTELAVRLRQRSAEIEETIFAHIRTLSASSASADITYMEGLRTAVKDIVEYGLASIELGEGWVEPIPSSALGQARRAARNAVSIDTVLRRYAAGERLLAEFIVEELEDAPAAALRDVLKTQRVQIDRVMAAVSAEYMREVERRSKSATQGIEQRVQRLLAADQSTDIRDLGYDIDAWHLGLVVTGTDAESVARGLASELDHQLLVVPRGERTVWAWLGGRRRPSVSEVESALAEQACESSVAVGEPRERLDGWRLTHSEARAAFQVMVRRSQKLTRARDIVLLAAVLRDNDLARSLRETYMAPLDQHGSSSEVLRETLRAYLVSGRNAVTAAAMLGVDRHTVQRRLRKIEDTLGQDLHLCHAELAVALGLEELDRQPRTGKRAAIT